MSHSCGVVRVYHPPSIIYYEYFQNQNIIEGEKIYYYICGTIASIENYVNNIKHGMESCYFENGKLLFKSNFINGYEYSQQNKHKNKHKKCFSAIRQF